jgi:hypothetical protein
MKTAFSVMKAAGGVMKFAGGGMRGRNAPVGANRDLLL